MTTSTPARKPALVVHPFLFGLYPLVSLLSANLVWAEFHEVFLPAVVVFAIAGLLWLLLWPLLPEPRKRGLVVSLFWLPFFTYGVTLDFIRDRLNFREMFSPTQTAVAGLVGLFVSWALIHRLRRSPWTFERLNTFLNRLSTILFAISLASCGLNLARGYSTRPPAEDILVHLGPDALAALPNIYFILCDAYPRADYLHDYFEFDNTPFLSQLRDRGFYVADRSRSNYCNTLPSLASTLNLEYLDPEIVPRDFSENAPLLVPPIQDNLVVRTLRAHGYEFVAIASAMSPTQMEGADRYIRPATSNNSEYQQSLIDMTPVRSILNRVTAIDPLRWYQFAPFTLDAVAALRRNGRPMFVFAHILSPHRPHPFDQHGRFLPPDQFPPYKEGWRAVTQFLNKRLIEVVDSILVNEPNSIIIIHGDHGCNAPVEPAITQWQGDWHDYVRARSANLSACYLPRKNGEGLFYPELTPVNLFRIIFDTYLNTSYGRLEGVTWLTPENSRELVRITEIH